MSFTPGIPASGQSLGNSRTQVLNNFSSLRSTLDTDHVDVNEADAGQHIQVTLNDFGSFPYPVVGNQSYIAGAAASSVANQIRVQPAYTNVTVPMSPIGMMKAQWTGTGWVSIDTSFNSSGITNISPNAFSVTFQSTVPSINYHVNFFIIDALVSIYGHNLTTSGFQVVLQSSVPAGAIVSMMVYDWGGG